MQIVCETCDKLICVTDSDESESKKVLCPYRTAGSASGCRPSAVRTGCASCPDGHNVSWRVAEGHPPEKETA